MVCAAPTKKKRRFIVCPNETAAFFGENSSQNYASKFEYILKLKITETGYLCRNCKRALDGVEETVWIKIKPVKIKRL